MEARKPLTPRQEAVLLCIREHIETHHHAPTIREIGLAVGLQSTSSVKYQLDVLCELGYVMKDTRRPRTMEITDRGMSYGREDSATTPTVHAAPEPPQQHSGSPEDLSRSSLAAANEGLANFGDASLFAEPTVAVPVVGRIAAGTPILAEQHVEEVFPIPRRLTGKGDMFALRVNGDSMIEAAICDGDWVVVRRQNTASNGEIVAAMIDGEATVKVLMAKDGHVTLLPCNLAYDPIPADDATVLGKVVSVLRAL